MSGCQKKAYTVPIKAVHLL